MEFIQLALPEERETFLHFDHYTGETILSSNHATIINRLIRRGFSPARTETIDGKPYACEFNIANDDLRKLVKVGMFKLYSPINEISAITENEELDEEEPED